MSRRNNTQASYQAAVKRHPSLSLVSTRPHQEPPRAPSKPTAHARALKASAHAPKAPAGRKKPLRRSTPPAAPALAQAEPTTAQAPKASALQPQPPPKNATRDPKLAAVVRDLEQVVAFHGDSGDSNPADALLAATVESIDLARRCADGPHGARLELFSAAGTGPQMRLRLVVPGEKVSDDPLADLFVDLHNFIQARKPLATSDDSKTLIAALEAVRHRAVAVGHKDGVPVLGLRPDVETPAAPRPTRAHRIAASSMGDLFDQHSEARDHAAHLTFSLRSLLRAIGDGQTISKANVSDMQETSDQLLEALWLADVSACEVSARLTGQAVNASPVAHARSISLLLKAARTVDPDPDERRLLTMAHDAINSDD